MNDKNIEVKKDTIGLIIWCDNCTKEERECKGRCSERITTQKKRNKK